MAHPAKFRIRCEALQMRAHAIAIGQRDPTHHAANQLVLPGEFEQPGGLFQRLPGLHGDRALNAEVVHEGLQIGGKKSRRSTLISGEIQPYSAALYFQR